MWQIMARVTHGVSLNPELLKESKRRAIEQKRSWSNYVATLLEEDLAAARGEWPDVISLRQQAKGKFPPAQEEPPAADA